MGRRHDRWHEVESASDENRKQKTLMIWWVVFLVILLLAVLGAGGYFVWKIEQAKEAKEAAYREMMSSMAVQSVQIPTPEPTQEPLNEVLLEKIGCIVLDAGHGGVDGGTFYKDVIEKNVNFSVVLYMQEYLEENGVEVILTRSEDVFIELPERTEIAKQNAEVADLFVSIHCNYFEDNVTVNGLECYYFAEDRTSETYAEKMIKSLVKNKELKVRGTKEGDYYVLKHNELPALLVEMGFLSNKEERNKLNDDTYQKMLAEELSIGIIEILQGIRLAAEQ